MKAAERIVLNAMTSGPKTVIMHRLKRVRTATISHKKAFEYCVFHVLGSGALIIC